MSPHIFITVIIKKMRIFKSVEYKYIFFKLKGDFITFASSEDVATKLICHEQM